MAAHPRRECLTWKPLGHINIIVAFPAKIVDLSDVDVKQLLSCRYMLLKGLALLGIDTRCRDQGHGNRLPSSLVHSFITRGGTGVSRFVRGAVILKANA